MKKSIPLSLAIQGRCHGVEVPLSDFNNIGFKSNHLVSAGFQIEFLFDTWYFWRLWCFMIAVSNS